MPDEYDIPILGPTPEFNPASLEDAEYTEEEKELLARKVVSGREVDPIPKIPDASDISPTPKFKVPGTFKNRIEGLALLRSDEIPVAGQHYVVWGSAFFSDIKARPVKRTARVSEDEHAAKELAHTQLLLDGGVKNPKEWTDPEIGKPLLDSERGESSELWDRLDRTDRYARWRYRGFVAGEVSGL